MFHFLVGNANMIIPYEAFLKLSASYKSKFYLQMSVSRIRPFLEMNGFCVIAVAGTGYECRKIERDEP